jgi:tRNA(Ile2)-agmatinylcytidine synthase
VGLDDTDSSQGGCTTWVLSELLREAAEIEGVGLVGWPRLVRLNPGVPWKTRGNAALAARFGRGRGRPSTVGQVGGKGLSSYERGDPLLPSQVDALWEAALQVLRRGSRWRDPGTDPTVVMSRRPLPPEVYWRAVQEEVPRGWVFDLLAERSDVRVAAFGSGQGIVGAAAALAWPRRRRTWEAIAYRAPSRWGTEREVELRRVRGLVARFPDTFLSRDEATRRTLVAPHTPCPILYGVRATSPELLPRALRSLQGPHDERPERWVLFETNQASGDHLAERTASEALPGTSGIFHGSIRTLPQVLRGGHVRIALEDPTGGLEALAFEPTRTLPAVARELLPGDRVRVWGSVPWGGPPGTIHLEGIQVLEARPRWNKVSNPRCDRCGRSMGSWGKGKGFRCPHCRTLLPPESAKGRWVSRSVLRGTHLATPSARRHLSPLVAPRTPRGRPPGIHIARLSPRNAPNSPEQTSREGTG